MKDFKQIHYICKCSYIAKYDNTFDEEDLN